MMIGSVCAEEVVAKTLFVGFQRCDYRDLCEVGGGGGRGEGPDSHENTDFLLEYYIDRRQKIILHLLPDRQENVTVISCPVLIGLVNGKN